MDEECWICFGGPAEDKGSLESPCKCPRKAHRSCIARWQLQQAGRSEESQCRFCGSQYGDWRESLTPGIRPATPVMAIYFEGQVHRVKVFPGPDGKARFEQQIRELLRLADDEEFDVEFECKAPGSSSLLHLDGMEAFDAATHCAAITAAERISQQQQQIAIAPPY